MARERLNLDLNAYDRPEKLETLGMDNIAKEKIFDKLLNASIEYQELRNILQKEIRREERETDKKKDKYGLNGPNPLED